jgi:hypothetical protein
MTQDILTIMPTWSETTNASRESESLKNASVS